MRTVAITGAGSGIGRAIAEAFVEAGDRVFISDILEDSVDQLAGELGDTTSASRVDVSQYSEITAFFQGAHQATGRLDVAINAAGVFDGYAGVLETSEDLWRRVIEINLNGTFFGCKAAAEVMKEQGSGRIISIGSVASYRGAADGIAYTAAKAGMLGLTRRLAVDVGRFGITANLICPGVIPTGIRANSEQVLGDLSPDQQQGVGVSDQLMDYLIPARRKGTPQEVAAVAVFLASEGAAYVNGESIAVDGGWLAV
jgi:NAD(P)-dependent dehydrogenase (short-subunit alcohol dehydrogenase family)